MMKILKYFGAACFSALMAVTAMAQSDPGISTHNYKHPNKAKLARQINSDGIQIKTMDYRTAARLETLRSRGKKNSFPKYARRYPSVVAQAQPLDRSYENNALKAPGNYKTQKVEPVAVPFTASMD